MNDSARVGGKLFLGFAAAIVGLVVQGCSSKLERRDADADALDDHRQGSIGLNLQPVSGVTIGVVSYTVASSNAPGAPVIKAGNLLVPGTGGDFSFGVPLPTGSGYFLSLSADSVDGKVNCVGGFGPFDIAANATVDVTPTLTCTDITTGQSLVLVDVTTTACPDISFDYVVASPKTARFGQSIALLSNAVSRAGKPLTYQWTFDDAVFPLTIAPPTAKNATLTCRRGASNVVLTVSASNGECSESISTKVSCSDARCGNGFLDPGENCDTALTTDCPEDCTFTYCGDGVIEFPEVCEPPNTPTCSRTCGFSEVTCGDGFITGSEPCDIAAVPTGAPLGTECRLSPTGQCVVVFRDALICGDGFVVPGEDCDPPFSVPNCGGPRADVSPGATKACQYIESAACISCVNSAGLGYFDCANLTGVALAGPGAGRPLKTLCYDFLDCMYDTNCAAADLVDCYCGTSGTACQTGGGNGKCRAEIEASLETTLFGDIGARIGDPIFAGGVAVVRVDGSRDACGAVCGTF